MQRWTAPIAIIALSVLLSGCAMPTSLRVASWAVDGITYLTTDKSVADHGLSALSGRDCKMLRLAKGTAACRAYAPGVDFNANLEPQIGGGLVADLPACASAKLADDLADGAGLHTCAQVLVERFGGDGALRYADWRILNLVDAGRTDDAGLWFGVQAVVRQSVAGQAKTPAS